MTLSRRILRFWGRALAGRIGGVSTRCIVPSLAVAVCLGVPRVAAAQFLTLDEVASGLARPISITNAGDGSGRLFIVQQGGEILVRDGDRVLPTPFLDISRLVFCCGEQGLLDIAFHPNYAKTGLVFVDYTDRSNNTVIARYHVSDDPNRIDTASATIVLRVKQPYRNHNGGQIRFGPDGYLYIGLGDGGSAGDPGNRAQNKRELLGKLLRIDVDRGQPYGIPPGNPFASVVDARAEIWALGLRNPWRFSFDRRPADRGRGSKPARGDRFPAGKQPWRRELRLAADGRLRVLQSAVRLQRWHPGLAGPRG